MLRHYAGRITLFFIFCLSSLSYSQLPGRLIILSPRVGEAVDDSERTFFRILTAIPNFRSASFYHLHADSFSLSIQRTGGRDDVVQIIKGINVRILAERVNNFESILRSKYRMGSTVPDITYADGTPLDTAVFLPPPPVAPKRDIAADRTIVPPLPLPHGSLFSSIRIMASLGYMSIDYSALRPLIGSTASHQIPYTFSADLPADPQRNFSLWFGAGGMMMESGGGNTVHGFGVIAFRFGTPLSRFRPFVAAGAGKTIFRLRRPDLTVYAGQWYPLLKAGISIPSLRCDAVAFIPLSSAMVTEFEGNQYRLHVPGPGIAFQIHLIE